MMAVKSESRVNPPARVTTEWEMTEPPAEIRRVRHAERAHSTASPPAKSGVP
jgi:hypothetical protein